MRDEAFLMTSTRPSTPSLLQLCHHRRRLSLDTDVCSRHRLWTRRLRGRVASSFSVVELWCWNQGPRLRTQLYVFFLSLPINREFWLALLTLRPPAVYLWTFDQFLLKLAKMRNVTSLLDKPWVQLSSSLEISKERSKLTFSLCFQRSYSQHFSSDEPFYENPPPSYSFIGNALVSLAPLSRRISTSAVSPIFCRITS